MSTALFPWQGPHPIPAPRSFKRDPGNDMLKEKICLEQRNKSIIIKKDEIFIVLQAWDKQTYQSR